MIARPCTNKIHLIVSAPVRSVSLGFQLLRDIDHRTQYSPGRDSALRTVAGVADMEPENSLTRARLYNLTTFALNRNLQPETLAAASNSTSIEEYAWVRWSSSRGPYASGHLTVLAEPQTTLSDDEFKDAICHRLGLSAPSDTSIAGHPP